MACLCEVYVRAVNSVIASQTLSQWCVTAKPAGGVLPVIPGTAIATRGAAGGVVSIVVNPIFMLFELAVAIAGLVLIPSIPRASAAAPPATAASNFAPVDLPGCPCLQVVTI